MPKITIGSDVINFPSTGSDAVWSQPVVDFAVAVESALTAVVSTYDISPNSVELPNNTTFTDIAAGTISFPSAYVASFVFTYSIQRVGLSGKYISEYGVINGVFNEDPGVNGGWKINHQFNGEKLTNGTFYHSFQMNGNVLQIKLQDAGTVEGKISYYAKTLQKEYT